MLTVGYIITIRGLPYGYFVYLYGKFAYGCIIYLNVGFLSC